MADEASTPEDSRAALRGSPVPGCLILGAIVFVFGGLIVLYTVVGSYQNRVIGGFTEDTPAALPVPAPTAAEIAGVEAKLALIAAAVKENRAERVLFTAADLNLIIAHYEVAKDFRGNTSVESIGPEGIIAAMAQPMRKGFIKKGVRYLNATFVLEPEVRARTIAFKVKDIRPTTGEMPPGFIDNYAALDFFRLDPENPAIKAHIESLGAVYGEEGQLVVETKVRADAGG
ncbi:MAG: hypothetical protein GXX91_04675 [Verrucomicrobiaceae bacterium]|nr:hypothetical protein [Verrucomicrobiaceae bacterium]